MTNSDKVYQRNITPKIVFHFDQMFIEKKLFNVMKQQSKIDDNSPHGMEAR